MAIPGETGSGLGVYKGKMIYRLSVAPSQALSDTSGKFLTEILPSTHGPAPRSMEAYARRTRASCVRPLGMGIVSTDSRN